MTISCLIAAATLWLSSSHIHAAEWKVPRTSWGAPDFEGITWNFATMTPLERPRGIDKAELTAQETVGFERDTAKARAANVNNGYDWWDPEAAHLDRRRTSLIIDPSDGRLPPKVASASARARRAGIEGPEDFPLNTRCLVYFLTHVSITLSALPPALLTLSTVSVLLSAETVPLDVPNGAPFIFITAV